MNQRRPALRCAIYTRVSDESGLEQEFNSLDNQREASEAYIKSQAHEGWRCLPARYDDGGFSGGSLERPALQRLLADIRQRQIDVVVVYKVDRLTRSLADFAKLVELFDVHTVSFVSVTQQFNTTTSMGRLTLNVLLSFAQFEREVIGERVRDKIAASKRKGIRMGGPTPLGYDLDNKKLVINKQEADRVRYVFRRYLELGSLSKLLADARAKNIRTKVRKRNGQPRGGVHFTRGALAYVLKNRVYVGDLIHKDKYFPGEHEPVLDRALFDGVQQAIATNTRATRQDRMNKGSLLTGRIYDDRGNRMTPVSAKKGGVRYRYYVSCAIFQARQHEAGSITRVSAPDLELRVLMSLKSVRQKDSVVAKEESDQVLVERLLERVIVHKGKIQLALRPHDPAQPNPIVVHWTPPPTRRRRQIIQPQGILNQGSPLIRWDAQARLIEYIAKARLWLDDLISGRVQSTNDIADREACSERSVRMTLGLAFLSPASITAAVGGALPAGMGIVELTNAPMSWKRQLADY
jgi:site-specific DNA recombinase